ncbi:MAG: AlbA family DNA-binding domain-containing protein [Armatimonadota bacterium]
MTEIDLLQQLQIGETKDWEFKACAAGLSKSMWETYSAMANTDGGVIVLGVSETKNHEFYVSGLTDSRMMQQQIWNNLNNRGHVNTNLLRNDDVKIVSVDGKNVIVMTIPRASVSQRPIYIGQNPIVGTFKRNSEGDYRCNDDQVKRMLADQSSDWYDSNILEHFTIDDLDLVSLNQYRNLFNTAKPNHPWLANTDLRLLELLGGYRVDRPSRSKGITVAGLLMFGRDEIIRDIDAIPRYHVDYREIL